VPLRRQRGVGGTPEPDTGGAGNGGRRGSVSFAVVTCMPMLLTNELQKRLNGARVGFPALGIGLVCSLRLPACFCPESMPETNPSAQKCY